MMTAIDFGCRTIRAARHSGSDSKRLTLSTEQSEYAVVPLQPEFRCMLIERKIPHAVCEDSIIVFGNRAREIRWLCRKPSAPLFTDGHVPTGDAPARQVLNLLTSALLSKAEGDDQWCVFTVPGGIRADAGTRFLSSLIRMQGYHPVPCSSTTAATLAAGVETGFSGITICLGAERCEISINRLGMEIASESIDIGSAWIDAELARQLDMCIWDTDGQSYLDVQTVEQWKEETPLKLQNPTTDRARTLSRLYGVVLDQIARSVHSLIHHPRVMASMPDQPLTVVCSGGPVQIGGFTEALTDRFIEQDSAERIQSVQIAEDPMNTVARGLLIHGLLEQRLAEKAA